MTPPVATATIDAPPRASAPTPQPPPSTMAETGLHPDTLAQLMLKTLIAGETSGTQLAEKLRLSYSVLDAMIQHARVEKLIEVRGATGVGSAGYRYVLTDLGRDRAMQFLDINRYVGPAPVPLSQYNAYVRAAMAARPWIDRDTLAKGFSNLIVNQGMYDKLGPAVNSGKSLFLYGAPGNGKTVVAEGIGRALGTDMHIPHAIDVDGQTITMFDPVNHVRTNSAGAAESVIAAAAHDRRWETIRRPVVVVGGELTLEMLDLTFNPIAKFYEAPIQMKANGGVFVVDDFGRQRIPPRDLLNRWIVPLEKRYDYLTTVTGKKLQIPFDQLIMFSTNLDPNDLGDDALLRRIKFKFEIIDPTEVQWREIWKIMCRVYKVSYDDRSLDYLLAKWYKPEARPLRMCQPRDILLQAMAIAKYNMETMSLSADLLDAACETYFISKEKKNFGAKVRLDL
jgi:hypothetical protein